SSSARNAGHASQGTTMRNILKLLLAAGACMAASQAPAETLQSVRDFVDRPAYGVTKISPNGEYLAITVDKSDQDVLAVLRTSDLSLVKFNQLTGDRSVGDFYGTRPERLLFNAVHKIGGYAAPRQTGA